MWDIFRLAMPGGVMVKWHGWVAGGVPREAKHSLCAGFKVALAAFMPRCHGFEMLKNKYARILLLLLFLLSFF